MKLLVAIPTKGRSSKIFKHTLRWVSRAGYDLRVFCEPSEIEQYREGAREANHEYRLDISDDNFVDIGQDNGGLSFVKQFIKDYATEHGYELVFKMDDDILRFSSRGRNKTDDLMILEFCEMVGTCRVMFGKYPDVAAVGFPYRNELFGPKQWSLINGRLQTAYIIRTEYLQSGYNTLEDFAQYIYIRSQNKNTLRYGLLGIDAADVGKNAGGLQLFNREEMLNEELPKLREMYPALEFKAVRGKTWSMEPVLTGEFFGVKKL